MRIIKGYYPRSYEEEALECFELYLEQHFRASFYVWLEEGDDPVIRHLPEVVLSDLDQMLEWYHVTCEGYVRFIAFGPPHMRNPFGWLHAPEA